MPKSKTSKTTRNGIEYYRKRISTDERDENGKKKVKVFYGRDTYELNKKIEEYKRNCSIGLKENNNSFVTIFKDWLYKIHMVEKKPSTIERYEGLFKNHIDIEYLRNIPINIISLELINEYQQLLLNNGRSVATIKQINKILKPFIRYANVEGLIIRDFSTSIKAPKDHSPKSDPIIYFTVDEQLKFLSSIENHRLYALFAFDFATGLRVGELLSLTWNDINFEKGIVTINKSIKEVKNPTTGKYELVLSTPKNGKTRNVSIPSKVMNILEKHVETQQIEKERARQLYNDKNLIFATALGQYISPNNLRKVYKKLLMKSNVPYKKFHSIRHTYATRLFEKNISVKIVSELLGHSDVSITMNIYIHVMNNNKINEVDVLNDLF